VGKQLFSYGIQEQEKRIGNTGDLTVQIIDHYRQVLLAENIYEVVRKSVMWPVGLGIGLKFVPIQRDSLKISLRQRNTNTSILNILQIEYSLAIKNKSFAPRDLSNNLMGMDVAYCYKFTIPTLPSGQKYYLDAVPGFMTPTGSGIDFNSIATLLIWIRGNWSVYGYWDVDIDGNLQLDSDVNYGTMPLTAIHILTH
jgi:hypothetical protein